MKSAAITHEVIGAAMEVHNLLGPGFLESIYKRAVIYELHLRGLSAKTEVELRITYKDHVVGRHRLDIVVNDLVIVELKAVAAINDLHVAQAISYLTATQLEVALVLNFGGPSLSWKRVIRSRG